MFVFLKAQAASITATGVDFLVSFILGRYFGCWYVLASAIGTIMGGLVHFAISRHWVFGASGANVFHQALKYILVWLVYLLLNTGLVFLLTQYGGINYLVSKMMVAVSLAVGYNFFLHKRFVFK